MVAVCRPAVLTGARKTRSRAVAPAIQHRAGERMTHGVAGGRGDDQQEREFQTN